MTPKVSREYRTASYLVPARKSVGLDQWESREVTVSQQVGPMGSLGIDSSPSLLEPPAPRPSFEGNLRIADARWVGRLCIHFTCIM